jgi:sialate O-acetylesterase
LSADSLPARRWDPMLLLRLLPAAFLACTAYGLPGLGAPFGDHAMLQAGRPAPVWGTASPGEHVTVTFAGQVLGSTAGDDGRWVVTLAPLERSSAGADLAVRGPAGAGAASHDVVVGDIWLFAGSQLPGDLGRSGETAKAGAPAPDPLLREYEASPQTGGPPRASPPAPWVAEPGPGRGNLGRIALAFARDIRARVGTPVGIILCSAGQHPIEAWMSPAALAGSSGHPWEAGGMPSGSGAPATLFDALIEPLLPISVRGVAWDGGEADLGRAAGYSARFRGLIRAWRAHLGDPDLPFLWTQLGNAPGGGPGCAMLRQAQGDALALPGTGQAVTLDLGDETRLSGDDAREIGRRLALLARARAYAMTVDDTGPVYSGAAPEGRSMRVRFNTGGEGLTAAGRPLQAFEVAGADRVFHPATAAIEGDTVIVRSKAVASPLAVRYAWRDSSPANLYSGAGLPAAPFRSDDW